jgi:hypothetical protein
VTYRSHTEKLLHLHTICGDFACRRKPAGTHIDLTGLVIVELERYWSGEQPQPTRQVEGLASEPMMVRLGTPSSDYLFGAEDAGLKDAIGGMYVIC